MTGNTPEREPDPATTANPVRPEQDRETKYMAAIRSYDILTVDERLDIARAVAAVADAEQADLRDGLADRLRYHLDERDELRAEVERLRSDVDFYENAEESTFRGMRRAWKQDRDALVARAEAAEAEIERLREELDPERLSQDYKPEGVDIVMGKLQDARRDRDEKAAALARVEALVEKWEARGNRILDVEMGESSDASAAMVGIGGTSVKCARDLRAALAGPSGREDEAAGGEG
jgi:hypothetical protein